MISEIVSIAQEAGFDLIPLIDHQAIQVALDKCYQAKSKGYFALLPRQEELRFGSYGITAVSRIELVATCNTDYTNSDDDDFNAVNDAVSSLRRDLTDIIAAVMNTGVYDNISRVSYVVVPYRYDSFQTAVTATFEISKPASLC